MKKVLLTLLLAAVVSITASARDSYSRDAASLPTAARTILKNNFKSEVSLIKIDKDFGRVSEYEVILTDGTEITFDRAGNWKEVEVRQNSQVPSKFIPAAISSEVKRLQKGLKVVGIEKKRSGYEVTLSNGIEMKFNSQGRFTGYDD